MDDLETRIRGALAAGPDACVALAVDLARKLAVPVPRARKPAKPHAARSVEPPAPLASLFAALGATDDVGVQDRLVAPSRWKVVDEKLFFAEENQDVCEWACDLEGDAPRVYFRHPPETAWSDDGMALAPFLLRFMTVETLMSVLPELECAPCLPDAQLAAVLAELRPLPFADAIPMPDTYGPDPRGRLYARGDVLALAMPNGEGVHTLWVAAPTRAELAFLEPFAGEGWD